jgi:hypothetical protein
VRSFGNTALFAADFTRYYPPPKHRNRSTIPAFWLNFAKNVCKAAFLRGITLKNLRQPKNWRKQSKLQLMPPA